VKGKRVFRRASPTELIYVATDMIVVSRSTLAGKITRAQFDEAVAHLEARYDILRSAVADGSFVERQDDRSPVDAWLPAGTTTAEAVYATLLNAPLDTGQRIYAIHVIAGEAGLDVFMLSSHAVTDATSLVELHAGLAYFCDCAVRDVPPTLGEQPFPIPIDDAVDRSLAALPAAGASPAALAGACAEIPLRAPYDGKPVRHRLERIVLDADEVHRIGGAAHAQGSSVHSLLLAAFAVAIRDVAEGRPRQILVRSSIDMRRRLEPQVSPELIFTAITGHVTPIPDLDRPFHEIARFIYDDIHAGVANGSIFHDYVNYPRAFGSKAQPPVAVNISDMQSVKFHWPTERLRVTGFEYALGWVKRFPNVSVTVFDGKLVANAVYVEEFAEPAVTRAISEGVLTALRAGCGLS